MTYENFRTLSGATLLNEPSISSFEKIEIDPKKIKRGDLFIGDSKEDIELALHNEAYGIVTESEFEILDYEIAWLRAENIDDVLIKLLRFTLLQNSFRFIYLSHIEIQLLKKIAKKDHLIFLSNDEKDNYKKIINADRDSIFFSTNSELLQKIYPEFETLNESEDRLFFNIKESIFLTDFIYHEKRYKKIKISPLFLNHLENIIFFLERNSISFEIDRCTFTSHFHPIFVNKKLNIRPFGKSDRVLVCESDRRLVEKELSYLKKRAPWAKIIEFDLSNLDDLDKLKSIEFNFAIIVTEYERLITKLESSEKREQVLLF